MQISSKNHFACPSVNGQASDTPVDEQLGVSPGHGLLKDVIRGGDRGGGRGQGGNCPLPEPRALYLFREFCSFFLEFYSFFLSFIPFLEFCTFFS